MPVVTRGETRVSVAVGSHVIPIELARYRCVDTGLFCAKERLLRIELYD